MSIQLDKVQPKNKIQLKQLVDYAFKHNIYDLNFIDTSKITDMSDLFYGLDPYNIDISEWDVSNVKDMTQMFFKCKNFNSDLLQKAECLPILFQKGSFRYCGRSWKICMLF